MTTPDRIGADPALGIGAGQTRRSTPVDLAREVLDRYERHLRDDTRHGMTFPMDRGALNLHINAAPILARAVLSLTAELDDSYKEITRLREQLSRVRALADELDREASEHMDRPVYSRSGTRIRTALNGGDR